MKSIAPIRRLRGERSPDDSTPLTLTSEIGSSSHPANSGPAIRIEGVSKNFGRHAALQSISTEIRYGELVGLLGPNGAGKSTLVKILDGVHEATSGTIYLDGVKVPSLAEQQNVGFVHQDLGLIDELSVIDNLRFGEPNLGYGPFLNSRAEAAAAQDALDNVQLDVPLTASVGSLSPAEKALLAVARVFARGARIMFIDEVTSTLPPSDAHRVTGTLSRAAERGAAIVMVTHKLGEVLDVTQRILILVDGRLAVDRPTAGLDHRALTDLLMAGKSNKAAHPGLQSNGVSASADDTPVLLEVVGAVSGSVGPIDLTLRSGDVLGIGGLPGSGLHDLALMLAGRSRLGSGTLTTPPSVTTALVPPNRETQGGFDDHNVEENLAISALFRWARWGGLLDARAQALEVTQVGHRLNIDPPDPEYRFGALSGGNKQKVILGRALLSDAKVLILCEPTRGVDISTRREIYDLIAELRTAGAAIVVLSSDTEDLVNTCHRISVIYDGSLTPPRRIAELTLTELEALL